MPRLSGNRTCRSGCSRANRCAISKKNMEECPCMNCIIKPRCTKICVTRKDYYSTKEYNEGITWEHHIKNMIGLD